MPCEPGGDLKTCLHITDHGIVAGYVVEPADPSRRFVVDLIVDGLPVAVLRACGSWSGEPQLTTGDGCYAFHWPMPASLLQRAQWVEARVANTDRLIGHVVRGREGLASVAPASPRGVARWQGGLVIRGWAPRIVTEFPQHVTAWIEGQMVAKAVCLEWETVERAGRIEAMPAFTLRLPEILADGRARSVDVMGADGRPLTGSPLAVVAFRDRLADLVERDVTLDSERIRARFADGLLPRSVPFSALLPWLERQDLLTITPPSPACAVVILIGEGRQEVTRLGLDADTTTDCQVLTLGRGVSRTSFPTEELERCLLIGEASGDLFVFTLAGTHVRPGAIAHLHQALLTHPESGVAYADVLLSDDDGRAWPLAWPDFDRERWAEQGYAAFCFALRREGVARAIAYGAQTLFEVFEAQLAEGRSAAEPVHVPRLLANLPPLPVADLMSDLIDVAKRRSGVAQAPVPMADAVLPSIHIRRRVLPTRTTAIVACRNNGADLGVTLANLRSVQHAANLDILLVDNGSVDPRTMHILADADRRGCRIIHEPGWFKPAHLLNRGAAVADSDLLLFMAPGIAMQDPAALDELIARVQQEDVGAASPLIVGESGVVEHAGYVVGPMPGVVAPFRDWIADELGYSGLLRCAHQRSAASAACLLTKRAEHKNVGGFDAVHFPLHVYDVDYCLKLRAGGRRIIVTPHARVHGTVSSLALGPNSHACVPTRDRELARLRQRWDLSTTCDPYYSPWLNTDEIPYSGLNWFPQRIAARQSTQAPCRTLVEGF